LHLLDAVVLLCVASGSYTPPAKYLIISNARNGTIGYVKVPPRGNATAARTLIASGLGHPQGIAVDQKRQLLLVADSELKKVVSYGLSVQRDGALAVDEQTPLAENVEARWVAVDGRGNVYFSDELANRILTVPARRVLDGDTASEVAFPRPGAAGRVSAPGGVAVDNFHVYWTNKASGSEAGTVVKGLEAAPNATDVALQQAPAALVSNVGKAYGVCVAIDNIFFTAPERYVYAVKSSGANLTTVSGSLQNPRGCAWDGDSVVYVADRSANGVFAFPGPMVSLTAVEPTQVVHFEDAFGVAVFSRSAGRWVPALTWMMPALVAAVMF